MKCQIDYADPTHPQITELLRQSHNLMDELFPDETNNY
ncbi:MAG: GNAT family N-acetyltransferase, partial [Rhodobacteraceae bacterium]|nr:GNAT family N-acetyltransferase [Paracoccaceae bacterium]